MSSRAYAVLVGGLVLGLLVGLVVALLHPVRYRAQASVVVAPAVKRTDPALSTMTHTVAALARSDAVAQNVVASLHLDESTGALRGDIGAHAHSGSALVTLTADQSTALGAERVLQQVAVVLQRLAASRLGGVVPGQLVVWDAPSGTGHALGKPYGSWLLGGGSVGLLLAAAALFVLRDRRVRRQRRPRVAPETPQRHLRGPAAPETAEPAGLSVPAAADAATVHDAAASGAEPTPGLRDASEEGQTHGFARRVDALRGRAAALRAARPRRHEAVAAPAIEEVADTAIPETVPEELTPEREPPREPAGQVAEMRRLIDAEPDAARQAEMQVYLDQLAPLADEDGNLPQNLLVVAEDIFGRLA